MTDILTTRVTQLLTTSLGRAPTDAEIAQGILAPWSLAYTHNTLNAGQSVLSIDSSTSIQDSLDELDSNGGGVLYLQPGTYTLTADISIPTRTQLIGFGPTNTVILANGNTIACTGTNTYSTGSVSAFSGTTVTGTGTSWLANANAGQSLFLGTRWYTITSVDSDTSLTVAEAYGDSLSFPSSYFIGVPKTDILVQSLGITGGGLSLNRTLRSIFNNIQILGGSLAFDSSSEINVRTAIVAGGTGISTTSCSTLDWGSIVAVGNSGNGLTLDTVNTLALIPGEFSQNAGDGISITGSTQLDLLVSAAANGSSGVQLVSGNSNVNIFNTNLSGNIADGLTITASSDETKVNLCSIQGNGGYGITVAASSCDNTLILGNIFGSNSSGAASDSGTGTLIRSNIGLTDN